MGLALENLVVEQPAGARVGDVEEALVEVGTELAHLVRDSVRAWNKTILLIDATDDHDSFFQSYL